MAKRNLYEELKKSLEEVRDIKRTKLRFKTTTLKPQKSKTGKKDEREC